MKITTASLTNYETRNEFMLTIRFIGTSIRYTITQIAGHQFTTVTEFCMVVPHVCESSVLNVPRYH